MHPRPVSRRLNVAESVVQISIIFLATAALMTLLNLIGLANSALFARRYPQAWRAIPRSKIDWMVQSIQEHADGTSVSRRSGKGGYRVAIPAGLAECTNGEAFEAAIYGHGSAGPLTQEAPAADVEDSGESERAMDASGVSGPAEAIRPNSVPSIEPIVANGGRAVEVELEAEKVHLSRSACKD